MRPSPRQNYEPWQNCSAKAHCKQVQERLLLDQLDDEDNEAGSDNAADDVADDSLDDKAACEPAEECTAYKSDQDVDIPGERTLHDDSCEPAANACNNKRNN